MTDDDGTSDVDTPSKKKVAKGEVKSEVVVKVKSEPKDEDEEGVEGLAGEGMGGEVAV